MTISLTERQGIVKVISLLIVVFFHASVWAETTQTKMESQPERVTVRIHSGRLEGFTLDKVYIDDIGHMLSQDIEFYSPQGVAIPKDKLKRGCRVKFVMGQENEVVVIQIE